MGRPPYGVPPGWWVLVAILAGISLIAVMAMISAGFIAVNAPGHP